MSKYIYICSAGHSGSTLLDLLIGSHSRVASLGEISQLPKNISLDTLCTCGKKVRSCSLWQKVIDEMNNKFDTNFFQQPYSLNLGYFKAGTVIDKSQATLFNEIKRKLVLGMNYFNLKYQAHLFDIFLGSIREGVRNKFILYDIVANILDVEKIVDSSKYYIDAVNLYQANPNDVRIILLVRDGRAVFYSGLKKGFSEADALNAWKRYYSRALPLLKRLVANEHLLWVNYESLVSNPSMEMKRICGFLDLNYEETMLNFSTKTHHSTNGNDMRFRKNSEIKIDTIWKQKLLNSNLKYFNSKAYKLNRILGYE
jgi:hypothetical protein